MKPLNDSIIDIDPERLDEEWIRQPKRLYKQAVGLANARLAYSEAKADLEVTKADVAKFIRRNPKKYRISKVTEPIIKERVVSDERVRKATYIMNRAKWEVDMAEAAVSALDTKKKGLESLVFLDGQIHRSTPKLRYKEASDVTRAHARRRVKINE